MNEMPKFLTILKKTILESKKYEMDPELYLNLQSFTEDIWNKRKLKQWKKQTFYDQFSFHTADGVEGLVKIYISPNLPSIAEIGTTPHESRDPMDFVMKLNPKKFFSKKGLFLTIYHEMIHAIDPSLSTKLSNKKSLEYDPDKDESYWGHPLEFFAITNEFLEGLQIEVETRLKKLKMEENKLVLMNSLRNILNFFSKNEELNPISLDILEKLDKDISQENKISRVLDKITYDYPQASEFLKKSQEPYFITYIHLIKKFNPSIWRRFLSMLFKTIIEIEKTSI